MCAILTGQIGRLQIQCFALLQTGNAGIAVLCGTTADAAVAGAFVMLGLGVSGDHTFKVTQDHLSRRLAQHIVGHDGNLAATAGCVNYEGGNTEAAGVTTQTFHDLDALADRGTEVGQTLAQVANINVVILFGLNFFILHSPLPC